MASALGRRPNALAAAGTDADEALSDDCLAVCGLCLLSAQRRLDASPSSRLLVNGAACPPMMQAEFLPKHPKWSSYPPRADRRRPARSRGDQLCSFEIGRFGRGVGASGCQRVWAAAPLTSRREEGDASRRRCAMKPYPMTCLAMCGLCLLSATQSRRHQAALCALLDVMFICAVMVSEARPSPTRSSRC
jgi:hypothetical protein